MSFAFPHLDATMASPVPVRDGGTMGDAGESDTAVLVLTYRDLEHYCDAVLENLDLFWPDHPPVYVATDGALQGEHVLHVPHRDFVPLLRGALETLETRQPGVRYVYLLLEDLAPLGPVDASALQEVSALMRETGGKNFFMPSGVSQSERATEYATDLTPDAEDLGLWKLKTDYAYYFSLSPSFWDVSYLKAVTDLKLERGVRDPWGFEQPFDAGDVAAQAVVEQHYFWNARWPTVKSGFLVRGMINDAVTRYTGLPGSPLMDVVLGEWRDGASFWDRATAPVKYLNSVRLHRRRLKQPGYEGPTCNPSIDGNTLSQREDDK